MTSCREAVAWRHYVARDPNIKAWVERPKEPVLEAPIVIDTMEILQAARISQKSLETDVSNIGSYKYKQDEITNGV